MILWNNKLTYLLTCGVKALKEPKSTNPNQWAYMALSFLQPPPDSCWV